MPRSSSASLSFMAADGLTPTRQLKNAMVSGCLAGLQKLAKWRPAQKYIFWKSNGRLLRRGGAHSCVNVRGVALRSDDALTP
jgi:hypothetical protein